MKNAVSVEQGYKLMFQEYPDVVDVDAMRVMLGGIGKRMATDCCGTEPSKASGWGVYTRCRKSVLSRISAGQKSRANSLKDFSLESYAHLPVCKSKQMAGAIK